MQEDDRLIADEVCALLGIKRDTWHAYVHRGQAPKPDGYLNRRTPYWLRRTITAWQAKRRHKGGTEEEGPGSVHPNG